MKHIYRFFGSPLDAQTWEITDPNEVNHIKKVLKLPIGTEVEITDFKGQNIVGELIEYRSETKSYLVKIFDMFFVEPPTNHIHLAIGALKPGSLDEILPMLVELSVDEISIFNQVGSSKKYFNDKSLERWERIVRASVKQCKRSRLPKLAIYHDINHLVRAMDASKGPSNKFYLDVSCSKKEFPSPKKGDHFVFVIGSEKGLNEHEIHSLKSAGYLGLAIGNNILRATTATLTVAALTLVNR